VLDPVNDILPVTLTQTPPATPGGAKVFDSFSRADVLLTFKPVLGLGSTEAGSLGPLVWQYTTVVNRVPFGIQQGRAVHMQTGSVGAWVVSNSPDMDVRVDRLNLAELQGTGLVFRLTDANNFYWVNACNTAGTPRVKVGKRVAGVDTTLATYTTGFPSGNTDNWTTLRVTIAGTTITTYVDAAQLGSFTDSTFASGNGAGLFAPPNASNADAGFSCIKYDNFTVI
jgi:hypothetical protein